MSIVVATPTGHVGSRVVELLVQAGERPVVLLRPGSRLDPALAGLLEERRGDLRDAGFVRDATTGADALFWVDPTDFAAEDPNAVTERLGANAVAAVRANGVPRVVFQSSIGAERRHGAGLVDGLARVEQQLERTGADVLHLRCGYFFTNLLGAADRLRHGVLQTAMDPERALPWVDPRDVGAVAAVRLLSRSWQGRVVQAVHGPADLSFRDVAEILTRATGRPVALEVVRDADELRALLAAGLSERAAAGVLGMTQGIRDDFTAEQPRSALTRTPTTLGEWAWTQLRPLLDGP